MAEPRPVLIDTDVYSLVVITRQAADRRVAGRRRTLMGRTVVIAAQTRTEVLAGALSRGWGSSRMVALSHQLSVTTTVDVDEPLSDECARLTADLHDRGHALAAKDHTGDRWIAATAVHHGLPLLSGDGIYAEVPGLTLLV